MDIVPILSVFKDFYIGVFSLPLFKIGPVDFCIGHIWVGGTIFYLTTVSVLRIFGEGVGAPAPPPPPPSSSYKDTSVPGVHQARSSPPPSGKGKTDWSKFNSSHN